MIDPEKKYFPNGCTVCGGKVQFLKESLLYICNDCGVSVSAHKEETPYNLLYEPKGYLATLKVNNLRKAVSNSLSQLYMNRIKIKTKDKIIETALINAIFSNYCIEIEGDEPLYGYQVDGGEGIRTVFLVDSHEKMDVKDGHYKGVTNRTKCNIWLAREMGMSTTECKIKLLSEPELEKAYKICEQGIKEAKRKSIY